MTKKLSIFTEKKGALGGFDYTVTRKLLGSPSNVDDLSLFVREVAQNTWDARLDKTGNRGATLDFRVGTFSDSNSKAMAAGVLNADPDTHDLRNTLEEATRPGSPYVIVRDCDTVGLAGATEADEQSTDRNFISFVRNIGQDTHEANSGGSFGFGKSVFFRYSDCGTIVTYSRTSDENGRPISRMIGMSLHKTNPCHTGRHWWGVPPPEGKTGFNQPLSGDDADILAEKIGFPPYEKNQTGTAIMLISPSFPKHAGICLADLSSPDNRELLAGGIVDSLLLWYWPRMMGSGARDGHLKCTVNCDGRKIAIPEPSKKQPLNLFTIAFREIQESIANPKHSPDPQVTVKYIKKGASEGYGYLAVFKSPKVERTDWTTQTVTPHHPFGGALWSQNGNSAACRSVALIRSAGQVVRYLDTVPSPLPSNEYGAVFYLHATGTDAEGTLKEIKASEPASHDDWSPVSSNVARYLVNKIRGEIQSLITPNVLINEGGSSRLGRVSIMLGGLWGDGEAGGGTTTTTTTTTTSSSEGSAKWNCELAIIDNKSCVLISINPRTRIPQDCPSISIEIKARAFGGPSMKLDTNEDSGALEVLNDKDEAAGAFLGWYATDPRSGNTPKHSIHELLATSSISSEMRRNGFYAVVRNATTFGLSIDVKLNRPSK
jgi:hypothetical protein